MLLVKKQSDLVQNRSHLSGAEYDVLHLSLTDLVVSPFTCNRMNELQYFQGVFSGNRRWLIGAKNTDSMRMDMHDLELIEHRGWSCTTEQSIRHQVGNRRDKSYFAQ